MNSQDVSLICASFTTERQARFAPEGRLWQAAPSAVRTAGGRVFASYMADNETEEELPSNYLVCGYRDGESADFKLCFYAYHTEQVRISEPILFLSPEGWLYFFWTQNYIYFDGRGGIWCRVCKDPDAPVPVFDEPRRICHGCMANPPLVLKDGRWLFPASVWTHMKSDYHPYPEYEKVSVWESFDKGETLSYVGGVVDDTPEYTENTLFEAADGRLCMLFRTDAKSGGIKYTESVDKGRSWSNPIPFVMPGPAARFMIARFPSGALLMVNHYKFECRENLTAMLSYDDGKTFPYKLLLDERRRISYPCGNITADGRVTLAYDRERQRGAREIMLASFTEADIRNGCFGEGSYTKQVITAGGKNFGI